MVPTSTTREGPRVAAALVLLELKQAKGPARALALFDEFDDYDHEGRRAITTAISLWDSPAATALATKGLEAASGAMSALWLEVFCARGEDPGAAVIEQALASNQPELLRAGLRALPHHADARAHAATLDTLVFGTDPNTRLQAMIAGLIFASPIAWLICRQLSRDPTVPAACELLATLGSADDCAALREWANGQFTPPHAAWCLGLTGRVHGIEGCLELLDHHDEARAHAAFDGFCAATGFEATVAAELDANAARAWWKQHRDRFDSSCRHVAGRRYALESVVSQLQSGPRPHREALARESWVRTKGQVYLWPGALAQVQMRALTKLEAAEVDYQREFDGLAAGKGLRRLEY